MIKGIMLDYGGTIDTGGVHWSEAIWQAYEKSEVPVTKDDFLNAYVFGEKTLGSSSIIKPDDNFTDVLDRKIKLQFDYLTDGGFIDKSQTRRFISAIAEYCYRRAKNCIADNVPVLEYLKSKYPIVLVTNFYGNIRAVLEDFGIGGYFDSVVESAEVGIRKPDPAIYAEGLKRLGTDAGDAVVIGDSYKNDINPGKTCGCKTVWLKVAGWDNTDNSDRADFIINNFKELTRLL